MSRASYPVTPLLIRCGAWAFRASLRACPPSFRRNFGDEMVEVFRRASVRARLDGGSARLMAYWMTAFLDIFRSALAERRPPAARAPAPRKRDRDMLDDLTRDLRFAARSLMQNPGFAAAALLSLALGIGANVAIFSLIDAVFLRPLPLHEPDRLVAPGTSIVTYPAYRDFRDRARSFEGLAAWDTRGRRLVLRRGDDIETVPGVLVSGNYFAVLGVEAQLGRMLAPSDDAEAGGSPVAVIGHDLWQRSFAAGPGVIGARMVVNGFPLTVVGVAPQGFKGERLNDVKEVWIPLAMHPLLTPGGETDLQNRDAWWIRMMGRLAAGASPGRALAELNAIGAQLAEEHPATDSEWIFEQMLPAQTIASISRREELQRFMSLLAATVGAALLIACANVSNLLLLRGEQRRGEIIMRRALGATRGRLLHQMLTESVLLALLGGGAGIAVATGALAALRRFELPGNIAIATLDVGLETATLGAALIISLATALVFGGLPALQGSRAPGDGAGRYAPRPGGGWMRGAFVAVQVALSLVLLAGGGLFVRSLVNAINADVGFDAEGVLIADLNMDGQGFDPARAAVFFDQVGERLAALPGVRAVSMSNAVPVETRGYVEDVLVEGFEPAAGEDAVQSIHMNVVSSNFFEVVGIPLLRGRVLDASPGSREVVINEALARRYWRGGDAIGRRLGLGGAGPFEVVGVAADTTMRRLGEEPFPYIFAPLFFGGGVPSPRLALRTDPGAGPTAAAIRAAVAQVGATVPVTDVRTWSAHTGQQTQTQQLGATLLGFFSIVALSLAGVGIYGVISFGVSRRRRELGIRAALGAGRAQLMRLALLSGALPLLAGIVAGVLLALAVGRAIAGLLFAVEPHDPATLATTVAAIAAIGLLAAWLPARRATRIDPRTALNNE
jgi:predicted permease